jgi:hypothetical protein
MAARQLITARARPEHPSLSKRTSGCVIHRRKTEGKALHHDDPLAQAPIFATIHFTIIEREANGRQIACRTMASGVAAYSGARRKYGAASGFSGR